MALSTDDLRDRFIQSAPQHADKIMQRDRVADRICAERGWDKNHLTIEQVLEIRKDPDWK